MKTKKRFLGILLSLALAFSLVPTFRMTTYADEPSASTYTIVIPSTLNVSAAGWNATDGISATGTLESGKKLTVTATSANDWALMSGDNSVAYVLATASTDTEATTSWEFDSLSSTATTKPMGIIVEDYSEKPAGTYQDTVTFTASVANAAPTYADKLVKCNYGAYGNCVMEDSPENPQFTGKTITADEAIALAQYMKNQNNDGKECAVFYGLSGSFPDVQVCFGKSDGTTGSGTYYYDDEDLGILGYNMYYVSNN